MLVRLLLIMCCAAVIGVLVYVGCVVWPLNLPDATGIIAAISCAIGCGMVFAVHQDSRTTRDDGIQE